MSLPDMPVIGRPTVAGMIHGGNIGFFPETGVTGQLTQMGVDK